MADVPAVLTVEAAVFTVVEAAAFTAVEAFTAALAAAAFMVVLTAPAVLAAHAAFGVLAGAGAGDRVTTVAAAAWRHSFSRRCL